MKKNYDVIGSGEGLSGLLACALLERKGLSCLWVDTAPLDSGATILSGIPLIMTETFLQNVLEPVLSRISQQIMKALEPERGLTIQLIDTEEAMSREPGGVDGVQVRARKQNDRYLALLRKSSSKPWRYLRRLRDTCDNSDTWGEIVGSALSNSKSGSLARLKAGASSQGMCAVEFGKIKKSLGDCMREGQGNHVHDPHARLMVDEHGVIGLNLEDIVHKGSSYLTEDPPWQMPHQGFYLYGQCREWIGELPQGVGDLMVISPPEDLKYPFVIRVSRKRNNPGITVQARIYSEMGLASLTEVVSWASGMITKRLFRLMPFLSGPLQAFEVVNPMAGNAASRAIPALSTAP